MEFPEQKKLDRWTRTRLIRGYDSLELEEEINLFFEESNLGDKDFSDIKYTTTDVKGSVLYSALIIYFVTENE